MFDDTLEWRNIGPFRGGRVVAVAGDPINQNNFILVLALEGSGNLQMEVIIGKIFQMIFLTLLL